VVRQIRETGERLSRSAVMWRERNDVAPGLRSVLSKPYVIFYHVAETRVEILRVLHGRRDFAAIFEKPKP
jgi:toxin ParE1/3/4